VAVGLSDGAKRDLSDLRAAAHDDDPLAIDLGERRYLLERRDAIELLQLSEERLDRRIDRELEVQLRPLADGMKVDVADVRVVIGKHFRHGRQHAGTI
jgi:hypothetical protein